MTTKDIIHENIAEEIAPASAKIEMYEDTINVVISNADIIKRVDCVIKEVIKRLKVWLTNQSNKPIHKGGDIITVILHFKSL